METSESKSVGCARSGGGARCAYQIIMCMWACGRCVRARAYAVNRPWPSSDSMSRLRSTLPHHPPPIPESDRRRPGVSPHPHPSTTIRSLRRPSRCFSFPPGTENIIIFLWFPFRSRIDRHEFSNCSSSRYSRTSSYSSNSSSAEVRRVPTATRALRASSGGSGGTKRISTEKYHRVYTHKEDIEKKRVAASGYGVGEGAWRGGACSRGPAAGEKASGAR